MRGVDRTELACPRCGTINDAHWQIDDEEPPVDGDFSVCARCITVNVYVGTPPTSVRVPTLAELTEIHANSETQRIVRGLAQVRMSNG